MHKDDIIIMVELWYTWRMNLGKVFFNHSSFKRHKSLERSVTDCRIIAVTNAWTYPVVVSRSILQRRQSIRPVVFLRAPPAPCSLVVSTVRRPILSVTDLSPVVGLQIWSSLPHDVASTPSLFKYYRWLLVHICLQFVFFCFCFFVESISLFG